MSAIITRGYLVNLCALLRQHRVAIGMRVETAAHMMGIPVQTYYARYETRNKQYPSLPKLVEWCQHFGIEFTLTTDLEHHTPGNHEFETYNEYAKFTPPKSGVDTIGIVITSRQGKIFRPKTAGSFTKPVINIRWPATLENVTRVHKDADQFEILRQVVGQTYHDLSINDKPNINTMAHVSGLGRQRITAILSKAPLRKPIPPAILFFLIASMGMDTVLADGFRAVQLAKMNDEIKLNPDIATRGDFDPDYHNHDMMRSIQKKLHEWQAKVLVTRARNIEDARAKRAEARKLADEEAGLY